MKPDSSIPPCNVKGKCSTYMPEKRLWVFTNTQKEADDYIQRLRAKDNALRTPKPNKE